MATSWIAVAANAAVGFLLTPYVLHHLGDEAYGLWVLTVNCVGYYGLLDIGVRSSILRYVSRHQELGNKNGVNEIVATAFYYYLGACAVVLLLTALSVNPISHFFAIRADLLPEFKSLYLLAGAVQAFTLPLIVFAGSLEAAGRFDQMYLTTVAGLAVRVVAIIAVVKSGGGLFAVGAMTLLSQLLVYCVQVPLAFCANKELDLHPRWVRRGVFRDMLRYGSVSVSVGLGEKMRGYIYPLLIARFLSPVAVTFFSLPVKLMAFPTDGVGTMTEIINPVSSQLEARNDFSRLRELILHSSQTAFLLLIPLATFLIVFGRSILTLWVGHQYASLYPVLVLLTFGLGAAATQCCIQSMLFGIERHKQLIWYRLGEGISVVVAGTVALKIWGLEAFAAVIAATLLVTSFVLVPRYLCRILGLTLRHYLFEAAVKPLVLAVPAIATYIALHKIAAANNWISLLAFSLGGGVVFLATLLFAGYVSVGQTGAWYRLGIVAVLFERFAPSCGSQIRAEIGGLSPQDSSVEW